MKIKLAQSKLIWHGDFTESYAKSKGKIALKKVAESLLYEANKDVPHMEGTLERSGDFSVEETPKGVAGTVFYDTLYATRLHENPQYNFNKGRKGKWLEDALNKMKPRYNRYLAKEYSIVFGGKNVIK